jgi:hypothetical protein
MTEEEWLTCTDLEELLSSLRGKASNRKLRLWAVACCRHVWALTCEQDRRLVDLAERFADSLVSAKEFGRAKEANGTAPIPPGKHLGHRYAWNAAIQSIQQGVLQIASASYRPSQQRGLLHDIFGNPFRPVGFDPAWRTTDVLLLARGIYEERAFDRMPILADALQDAGCDSDDILAHCRDASATHVRGCWVVDLVLGKE